MGVPRFEAYCHRCNRVTPCKRPPLFGFRRIISLLFGVVDAINSIDSYKQNRPWRCGICGTTYSLID